MKKIFFIGLAVVMYAIAANAQCVYPTDNVTINFKRKIPGLLNGKFSVSSTKKVNFAEGNLRYNSATQEWQLAANQLTYVGNAAGNTSIGEDGLADGNGIADLFGWVGSSSTWTGNKQYGLTSSKETGNVNGYGNVSTENLKSDWGALMGTGWRTLTSTEWDYLLNTRDGDNASTVNGSNDIRYAKATVGGISGVILFPDGETFASSEFTTVGSLNSYNANYTTTTCTSDQWNDLEEKGCVFLPAAGWRVGAVVSDAGSKGYYWSTSYDSSSRVKYATLLYFDSADLKSRETYPRSYGLTIRLVQDFNEF